MFRQNRKPGGTKYSDRNGEHCGKNSELSDKIRLEIEKKAQAREELEDQMKKEAEMSAAERIEQMAREAEKSAASEKPSLRSQNVQPMSFSFESEKVEESSGIAAAMESVSDVLADGIRAAMPARTGPFAAAIMVGDRAAIGQEQLEDLRASNLAHLLAISGLHMGLLTGFVFAALRYAMALSPFVALRWPVKPLRRRRGTFQGT